MVAETVPALVPVNVPILTGLAKLPEESDNCAVNTLPELKVWLPMMVKDTLTVSPAQKKLLLILEVEIPELSDFVRLLKMHLLMRRFLPLSNPMTLRHYYSNIAY